MRFDPKDFGGPLPENPYQKFQKQAQRAAPKALKLLIELIHNIENKYDEEGKLIRAATPPRVIVAAINALLDRAYGRPAAIAELPAQMQNEISEVFRRIVNFDGSDRDRTLDN